MATSPAELSEEMLDFLTERHLASLTISADGEPLHVSAVGFTWDDDAGLARIITFAASKKVRVLEASGSAPAVLCQIDGGRWLALHGVATVTANAVINADAEARYAARYRPPGDRGADRRTIEVAVSKVVGRA